MSHAGDIEFSFEIAFVPRLSIAERVEAIDRLVTAPSARQIIVDALAEIAIRALAQTLGLPAISNARVSSAGGVILFDYALSTPVSSISVGGEL